MIIKYQMTEEDILAGNNLWRRSQLKLLQVVILTALVALAMYLIFVFMLGYAKVGAASAAIISAIAIIAVCILKQKYFSQKRSLQYFRDTPTNRLPLDLQWDEVFLSISHENGFNKYRWKDYKAWTEDETVLVLLHHTPLFTPLPKRLLSEKQQNEINNHIAGAAIPKARLFPL